MRQRIEKEQLNELTDEQKKRLQDWWEPNSFDVYMYQDGSRNVVGNTYGSDHGDQIIHLSTEYGLYDQPHRHMHYKVRCLPLLSVGQMIEFIEVHYGGRLGSYSTVKNGQLHTTYHVDIQTGDISFRSETVYAGRSREEYADVLWAIVKKIL